MVLVSGTLAHTEALRPEVAAVLCPMGLRLSEEKTTTVHIDEGFDFLGFRIQRQTKRGSAKRFVYTWPSKKALASIKAKVRTITRQGLNDPLASLLRRLNTVLHHKYRRARWKQVRARHLPRWWPTDGATTLFATGSVAVTRYRHPGSVIPTPWEQATTATT